MLLHACFLFLFHFYFHHPIFAWIALSGFRPTGEINSFHMPLFLPELPLKVVNPSGCSFLPKPPFRVFDLASIFIFHAFHSVFSFLPLTTDRYLGESLLVTCIRTDINVYLFMPLISPCQWWTLRQHNNQNNIETCIKQHNSSHHINYHKLSKP